ncbi:uncharacterized protein LOC136082546 [Hydra vulgaris]|uniref:Uncharacterized protein LOC136082546 n=1 Tax=Hydra vulgaris TaxID=6087 RepID=A0ABM4C8T7_HYDVU
MTETAAVVCGFQKRDGFSKARIERRDKTGKTEEDLKKELLAYKDGFCGLNERARLYGTSKLTLRRHLLNKNKFARDGLKVRGSSTNFPPEVEEDLVKHILLLEGLMFGITRKDLTQSAFQLADANNLPHNFNKAKRIAGKDWYNSFMKRHPTLSLRQPEPQASTAKDIYNMDKTNLSTVSKSRHKITAAKGKRQVGSLSSAEKGVTTTSVFSMNAAGNFLPPMVIFKRKRMRDELKDGAPSGSVFACNDSGWMDIELFEKWIDHFITYVKPSKDHPILLILDGHATHTKNLNAILKASESGVIMLSLPPHTAHRMQPLDISVFKPLQTYYEQEVKFI